MPIPDYQTLMLPLLRLTEDEQEHTLTKAAEVIAQEFDLTDAERVEMLPSGGQLKLYNRIGWSRTYLAKAGLLEAVGRGRFRITDRGAQLLKSNPPRIDLGVLNQYPEFREFKTRGEVKLNMQVASEKRNLLTTLLRGPGVLLDALPDSSTSWRDMVHETWSVAALRADTSRLAGSTNWIGHLVVDVSWLGRNRSRWICQRND